MARRNFNEEEQKVIQFWKDNNIFQKSVDKDAPKGDYIFYDGPPFATGLPHYGHIIGSILKDVVPRYKTMRGYRVERKWGWDCHGLPIENIVEKELGVNSKKEIEEQVGIAKFNEVCHSKVMTYAEEWKKVIARLGRFVDMENDYKTMDKNYMESIWWVFKQLWDKDLVYHNYRSMHVCPRCETTLSQSEVTEGYADVKDLSVTAEFELIDEPGTFVLAWTTTPWTLPGNMALAFGPDIDYVKIEKKDEGVGELVRFILAKDLLEKHFQSESEAQEYTIVEEFKGKDFGGKKYKPLFPYYENLQHEHAENSFITIVEEFVTAEDGTGVVHIAPGFGEDDFQASKRHNIPFVQHVSADGRYKSEVTDWPGREVKPKDDRSGTDVEIIKYLAAKGTLFSKEKIEHSYPHCWRCDSPLLNYSTSSWFVAVTKVKDRALELAKEINWTPGHIKEGRFGMWLAGARDWSISRQRFWGSVIPVWQCQSESCSEQKVLGSIAELEELTGEKVEDLHKHVIDEYEFPCFCGGSMKRIPDVLDCWFEAGSMPYAQMHYPFENEEKFLASFPAGYIAEGVDQTRAWFYYLHVLSTAIMDKPAFQNVIVNGMILAEDGKKMSKRLQNYPDPMYVMERYGSDAMRLYMMNSPAVYAGDLHFSEKGVEEVFKKVSMMWWNIYSFYEMNKTDELLNMNSDSSHPLDEWMHHRLQKFVSDVTSLMEEYELMKASRLFADFINDVSTWYVRRSRDRFKSDDTNDKAACVQMLREVLMNGSKVMAPFIPFITEDIFSKLRTENDAESIHLESWPEVQEYSQDVLDYMTHLRNAVELVLSIRSTQKIKVRQALQAVYLKGVGIDDVMKTVLADELNVKEVHIVDELPQGDNFLTNENVGISVALDIHLTEELKLDGFVRELIRFIIVARKNAGKAVDEKSQIHLQSNDSSLAKAVLQFENEILANCNLSGIVIEENELEKEFIVNEEKVTYNLEGWEKS